MDHCNPRRYEDFDLVSGSEEICSLIVSGSAKTQYSAMKDVEIRGLIPNFLCSLLSNTWTCKDKDCACVFSDGDPAIIRGRKMNKYTECIQEYLKEIAQSPGGGDTPINLVFKPQQFCADKYELSYHNKYKIEYKIKHQPPAPEPLTTGMLFTTIICAGLWLFWFF